MGYAGIIMFIFVMLIVVNLVTRAMRNRKGGDFEDEYFRPATGREAPKSASRWQARDQDWGARINRADAKLGRIKSQVDELPAAATKPAKDLSDLTPARRKIEAQQYLNMRRGKNVRILIQGAVRRGQVATVTASKVMLREPGGSDVVAVNLEDVLGIS